MTDYSWPRAEDRALISEAISRRDGPVKSTGQAQYSQDVRRPGMLFAKILTCPHAHARIARIDLSAAENISGVKGIRVLQNVGSEIKWAHAEIVAVAATSEQIARDAVSAVQVDYDVLPHFVDEENLGSAPETKAAGERVDGDPHGALSAAAAKIKGYYGCRMITHCCLETHGQVTEWQDRENLTAWISTQAVSGVPGQIAEKVGVPASNVRCVTEHMGGGFGCKFSPDRWGIESAELARDAGRPVKLFLDRDMDQAVAGARPSYYAEIEMGASEDGDIVAWSSNSWGSGGPGGAGSPPLPYVWEFSNQRRQHTSVPTNVGPARAWRAPGHPQAALLTMAALEDLAAELKMDPLDLVLKNIDKTGARASVYVEEFAIGAELMDWGRWHRRGESGSGPVKQGLGLSLHTWGGRGHGSNCEVVIYPDGLVEAKVGTQDLGTGTRTVIAIVAAETMGISLDDIKVSIGDSRLPASGGSGGSTTVGGVTGSTRRAAINALETLFEQVAAYLDSEPANLEARDGKIQVKGDAGRILTWKQATAKLGVNPIVATGKNPGPGKLNDSGVGGIQMADVSVDMETGIVKVNKMVAVQDCGLVVDMKTATSQVHGAVIMGISYALSEEKIFDPHTGRMLNDNVEFYKLAGFGEIGEIVVHMMTGPGYDERGVIGLGEPPVISPGAAISNAVANAIGVRVPYLPLTPDQVLAALEGGKA